MAVTTWCFAWGREERCVVAKSGGEARRKLAAVTGRAIGRDYPLVRIRTVPSAERARELAAMDASEAAD